MGAWALFLAANALGASDEHVVFRPPASKGAELPYALMVLIPGAGVATSYYEAPLRAIQEAVNLRLWAVSPAIPGEKCIVYCESALICAPLHALVSSALEAAAELGWEASAMSATFLTGHSLGAVCAATLAEAYEGDYDAAVVMGACVTDVASFPLPVLTLGAELDGGGARPGYLSLSLQSSDAAATAAGHTVDSAWQRAHAPAVILPGLDHSSFCPGFQVPGDVFPADASNETALALIASTVAAFLHLQMPQQGTAVVAVAEATLRTRVGWTRELLAPLLAAQALEGPTPNGTYSPWCATAQHVLASLAPADDERLEIPYSSYIEANADFEHSRVLYGPADDGGLVVNISGHNRYYGGRGNWQRASDCVTAAAEIGCKLASGERVNAELGLEPRGGALSCKDVNVAAVAVAVALLEATDAGRSTLARWRTVGRPLFLADDSYVFGNIGPLFVLETLHLEDNGTGLVVASLALGPQPLDSGIFPGVHYCKLLSPARVIDWIMIDSLKPKMSCLNI